MIQFVWQTTTKIKVAAIVDSLQWMKRSSERSRAKADKAKERKIILAILRMTRRARPMLVEKGAKREAAVKKTATNIELEERAKGSFFKASTMVPLEALG
jgi:hypothetical protein